MTPHTTAHYDAFERMLRQKNHAENTIIAYLFAVRDYHSRYPVLNKQNLLAYKVELLEAFKPRTVNQRIQAINKYLTYIGKEDLHLQSIKIQEVSFVENVISNEEYELMKSRLREEPDQRMHFAVRYMAGTGA